MQNIRFVNVLRNLNDKNEIDYKVICSFLHAGFYDGFSLFHKNFESGYLTKVFGNHTDS